MKKIQELEKEIKDINAAMVDADSKEMLAEPLAEAQRQLDAEKEKQAASDKKPEKKTPEKTSIKKRVVSKVKKKQEEKRKEATEAKKKKEAEDRRKNETLKKKEELEEKKKLISGTESFDKAVKMAIVTLNKKRYVLKEVKNNETKKIEKVHHTPEYRNSKIIKSRVEKIFNSSIYDITNSRKKKEENKEIVKKAEQLKDLFIILLNEIDAIINSTEKSDIDNIIGLIKELVKQGVKNDPKDKYKNIKWMQDLLDKYKI